MNVGILGGTFDPPHEGHLALARAALRALALDRILFIPTAQSPHKHAGEIFAPSWKRYDMVRQLLADEPRFLASDLEVVRGGVSYTVDTLWALATRYLPTSRFFLLMGADMVPQFPTWRGSEEIRKLATLVVAGRPLVRLEDLPPEIIYLELWPHRASSTAIRQLLGRGLTPPREWLPPRVLDYIARERLYGY